MSENQDNLGFPNTPVGAVHLQLLDIVKELCSDMVCSGRGHGKVLLKVSSFKKDKLVYVWLMSWAHNLL